MGGEQQRPGFLRVDTVHQGDRERQGPLPHQHRGPSDSMAAYGRGHERFLLVLQALLSAYASPSRAFTRTTAPNASTTSANLLNKLHSPPWRHSNDNALVGAAVVDAHIPKRLEVNHFTQNVLSPLRPASSPSDPKGRIRTVTTTSPATAAPCHPVSQTPTHLRKTRCPRLCSDLDAAQALNDARDHLFRLIYHHPTSSAA